MNASKPLKFRSLFFFKGQEIWPDKHPHDRLGKALTEMVAEERGEGYEFVDVKFAQSSASGTGMSALVIFRKI